MKNYIYHSSIFLIIGVIFYVSSIIGILQFIIFTLIYGSIFYVIYFLYKKSRKQKTEKYNIFLLNFIKKISLSIIIISILIGSFGYYQTHISPAKMIEYTISNGKKTVVFQEMSHIGAKSFYETVKYNLISYKNKGFVYFYEGVKPGKKENMNKFDEAIGINFNPDLYKNFSKLYGVNFQDNSIYLNLINNLDFNIDVDIDWIITEYEKNNKNKKIKNKDLNKKEIIDANAEIIKTLSSLNEKELNILVFINKSILSALIKSDSAQKLISDNFANKELFEVILEGRNKILSSEIVNSKYDKIYVTYGKLHFKGVLKLLQNQDKNWKIVSKKELISI